MKGPNARDVNRVVSFVMSGDVVRPIDEEHRVTGPPPHAVGLGCYLRSTFSKLRRALRRRAVAPTYLTNPAINLHSTELTITKAL